MEWVEELKRREPEVIETLKHEGKFIEACFLDEDTQTMYYLIEARDFEQAEEAYRTSHFPIDFEHRSVRNESLEKVDELTPLFYFSNK